MSTPVETLRHPEFLWKEFIRIIVDLRAENWSLKRPVRVGAGA